MDIEQAQIDCDKRIEKAKDENRKKISEIDLRHEEALQLLKDSHERSVSEMSKELAVAAKAFQMERARFESVLASSEHEYL